MAYVFQKELDFALALLRRMRIPAKQLRANDPLFACDGGLRRMLGMEEDYENKAAIAARWSQERTVYKVTDQFLCRYIYFRLPGTTPPSSLVLGPYLTADLSPENLMELAEQLQIPMSFLPHLANHYASLPVYQDPSAILAVVYTLGEALWGSSSFASVDVYDQQSSSPPATASAVAPMEQTHILHQMQHMEERYAYEDKLMEIVSRGLTGQAEILLSSVSRLNFEPRAADPLRNQKNYCIICNTLLRKAAQKGGAHPFHIDGMSSRYARTIENAATLDQCSALIGEMITAYCRLVHEQTKERYSPTVQKIMSYIDANLSGDLSLPTLAQLVQVTPSYLSALFHREAKHTLAEHIALARMQAALSLLKTTHLQIQTIAQLCGFNDPNYFGKQFRRHYGITPLQYRRGQSAPPGGDAVPSTPARGDAVPSGLPCEGLRPIDP